ncbi:hypothetical protein LCGC14_0616350 [marine sediment metagenome]|uniref:Uncharacterized protein n=1 Tax=marine sediment metagenome TaxID=412755 RepID=A0A0F9RQG0_9ZZZZ|nr:MAG: hypothetical protein Lokiarch_16780 [Candidatus Lokiarchaeum sp. GC14_75]
MKEIKFGHQLYFTHSYDFFRKKVIAASKEKWDSIWLPDHLTGMSGALIITQKNLFFNYCFFYGCTKMRSPRSDVD